MKCNPVFSKKKKLSAPDLSVCVGWPTPTRRVLLLLWPSGERRRRAGQAARHPPASSSGGGRGRPALAAQHSARSLQTAAFFRRSVCSALHAMPRVLARSRQSGGLRLPWPLAPRRRAPHHSARSSVVSCYKGRQGSGFIPRTI